MYGSGNSYTFIIHSSYIGEDIGSSKKGEKMERQKIEPGEYSGMVYSEMNQDEPPAVPPTLPASRAERRAAIRAAKRELKVAVKAIKKRRNHVKNKGNKDV